MRPPEIPIRIGRLAGGDDAACRPALVHHDDLDAVQVIRGQAVLAAQETERAAEDVPAHPEVRALAGGKAHAPSEEQLPIGLARRRARLHHERAALRVVGDVRHQ